MAESDLILLVFFNTTTAVFFVLTKYLSFGVGNRLLVGSGPDYVSVCVLNFLLIGEVEIETPLLRLPLVSGLTPSIDAIHESFSSLPGVFLTV